MLFSSSTTTILLLSSYKRFRATRFFQTVYPRLHELDAEGVLDVHELVQTKQYSISGDPAARDRIQRAVFHHLAIAMFLHASLDDV